MASGWGTGGQQPSRRAKGLTLQRGRMHIRCKRVHYECSCDQGEDTSVATCHYTLHVSTCLPSSGSKLCWLKLQSAVDGVHQTSVTLPWQAKQNLVYIMSLFRCM